MHQDRFKEVLAVGNLDIREYVDRYRPPTNFDISNYVHYIELVLDSHYYNEVLLHLRFKHSTQVWSRNDGLKIIRTPNNYQFNKLAS